MIDTFDIFLAGLKKMDEISWGKLYRVAKTMIEHFAEAEKYELDWVANSNGTTDTYPHWFENIFEVFKNNFNEYEKQIGEFEDVKKILIGITKSELDKMFALFCKLMIKKEDKTWQLVHQTLQKKLLIWVVKQGVSDRDVAKQIYFEGFSVLFEKLTSSKANFEDSKKLKSYFIKILENKIKEYHRHQKRQLNYFDIGQLQNILPPNLVLVSEPAENRELVRKVQNYISKLEPDEREIIVGFFYEEKKLKDIAVNLSISEENCRVIKYRVLKKLKALMGSSNLVFEL